VLACARKCWIPVPCIFVVWSAVSSCVQRYSASASSPPTGVPVAQNSIIGSYRYRPAGLSWSFNDNLGIGPDLLRRGCSLVTYEPCTLYPVPFVSSLPCSTSWPAWLQLRFKLPGRWSAVGGQIHWRPSGVGVFLSH
jgi:hypothetical protein